MSRDASIDSLGRTQESHAAWSALVASGPTRKLPDGHELGELCTDAGDKASLALGTAGQLLALTTHARYRESSRLAAEYAQLLESIDDPTMTVRVLPQVIMAKYEAGDVAEALRLSQRVIDMADGDLAKGNRVYLAALARATMMNKNVTTPEGAAAGAADTLAECHTEPGPHLGHRRNTA